MSVSQSSLRSLPFALEIESRLARVTGLPSRLEQPNLPAAREAVAVFRDCYRVLSAHAHLGKATVLAVEHEALYRSFDAFLALRSGETTWTASLLLEVWTSRILVEVGSLTEFRDETLAFVSALLREAESLRAPLLETLGEVSGNLADRLKSLSEAARSLIGSRDYTEWLLVFNQAVEQVVAPDLGIDEARSALRSLMTRLELSQDDLGRMFGVSGETIRRWERGSTAIPADRRSAILAAESSLRRLQDLFRPGRLPTVVRRAAEAFDGDTALEWILRGRIADVADRYEVALVCQG